MVKVSNVRHLELEAEKKEPTVAVSAAASFVMHNDVNSAIWVTVWKSRRFLKELDYDVFLIN